jgi:hypothetical protein
MNYWYCYLYFNDGYRRKHIYVAKFIIDCQNLLGSEYSITLQCSAAANILPFKVELEL